MKKTNLVKIPNTYTYKTENEMIISFSNITLGKYKDKTFIKNHDKDDTYYLVLKMENYKKPNVFGDRYSIIPTYIEYDETVPYTSKEIFFNEAREAYFVIDSTKAAFKGYTCNKYWNGWDMPYFDKETCFRILETFSNEKEDDKYISDDLKFWYDESTDTFMEQYDDESYELGTPHEVNGEHVYDLGAGNWIWSEIDIKNIISDDTYKEMYLSIKINMNNMSREKIINQMMKKIDNLKTSGHIEESYKYLSFIEKFKNDNIIPMKDNYQEIIDDIDFDVVKKAFGNVILQTINKDDNYPDEIGKFLLNIILGCKTERELEIVDKTVIAITGYSLETLLNNIYDELY